MTRTAPTTPHTPWAPEKTVVFAVGDIHGRLDLLDGVVAQLRREVADGERLITVFLGDYIDRGPQSAGVVDRLIELQDAGPGEFVFLRGNHEQVLLDLADGGEETTRWLNFGGRETLASYGVEALGSATAASLREAVRRAVPQRHLDFLRATRLSAQLGDYFFVHAGLRPDRLVEEQSDSDLLWYRYYNDEAPVWDHMVVHGHSPNPRPVKGRWRIGVDTEAYASGALTALRLEGEAQSLLRISLDGSGAAMVGPWESVDRAYADAAREHSASGPDAGPRSRTPTAAPRGRAMPKPPKPGARKSQQKLRRRGRRLAWGTLGALAVASCTGLVLSAQNLIPPPAAPQQQPAASAQPDLALRGTQPGPLRAEVATLDAEPAQLAPAPPAAASPAAAPEASAAPAPAAAPPAEAAPAAGPRVQVAAADSEAAAKAFWTRLEGRLPPAAARRTMRVEPAEVGGRAVHRVLVEGFASAGDAAAFCTAVKEIGEGCLVRSR